jgi:hypothetical protein
MSSHLVSCKRTSVSCHLHTRARIARPCASLTNAPTHSRLFEPTCLRKADCCSVPIRSDAKAGDTQYMYTPSLECSSADNTLRPRPPFQQRATWERQSYASKNMLCVKHTLPIPIALCPRTNNQTGCAACSCITALPFPCLFPTSTQPTPMPITLTQAPLTPGRPMCATPHQRALSCSSRCCAAPPPPGPASRATPPASRCFRLPSAPHHMAAEGC